MKNSKMEQLYNLYVDNPHVRISEAAEALDVSESAIRTMKYRMGQRGFIMSGEDGEVIAVKPWRENLEKPLTLKAAIYQEMVQVYMEDFRVAETFKDRLEVGQEIRLILKNV